MLLVTLTSDLIQPRINKTENGKQETTQVEKEKLIDLLFTNNERLMSELAGLRQDMERQSADMRLTEERSYRFEQRALAAERRADREATERRMLQSKIDQLLSLVKELRNGDELRAMTARAEKAEKTVADLLASGRRIRVTSKATNEALANNRH